MGIMCDAVGCNSPATFWDPVNDAWTCENHQAKFSLSIDLLLSQLLHVFWGIQEDFQKRAVPGFEEMDISARIALSKDYLLSLISETDEVLDALGMWKQHSSLKNNTVRSQIAEEAVDIFKFLVNILVTWDISSADFERAFFGKTMVVEQRFNQEEVLKDHSRRFVVVDLDGVLGDHRRHLITYYNQVFKTDLPVSDVLLSPLVGRDEYFDCRGRYIEEGMFREIKEFPESIDFLRSLKKAGYTIVIVSSRPYHKYKRIFVDTLLWLKDKGMPFDVVVWGDDKGAVVHKLGISPEWFVDDEIERAMEIVSRGFKCYLLNKSYNQGVVYPPSVLRIDRLHEILENEKRCQKNG